MYAAYLYIGIMLRQKRGPPRAQAATLAAAPGAAPTEKRAGPKQTPQTPFEATGSSGETTIYAVDYIRNMRFVKGVQQYEVVWEGYTLKETTWEPMDNLSDCAQQIMEYEQKRAAEDQEAPKCGKEVLWKRQRAREEKEMETAFCFGHSRLIIPFHCIL